MTRPRLAHFAGAAGRAHAPDEIARLDFDRWAVQVKADGLYCQLTTGPDGRIDSAVSQLGAPIAAAADLLGIHAAPPYSTLVGELEAHTEHGIAAASERGYAVVHLFDCLRLAGVPLHRQPYQERHGSLYRAQSWVESEGLARVRDWTLDARGNAHAAAGRFVSAIPRDLRRLPVVPLARGRVGALELWARIEREGLEGAVAVDLTAPVGRAGAKRKIKLTDTLDCAVLRADASCSEVRAVVRGRPLDFAVPGVAEVGGVVEVAHHGWYGSGLPRFPRIVRARRDKPVPDHFALVDWRA